MHHVDPDARMSVEAAYRMGALGQRIFAELEALAPEGAMVAAAAWVSRVAADASRVGSVAAAELSPNGWASFSRVATELEGELPALVALLGEAVHSTLFAQIVAEARAASEARLELEAAAGRA